MISELAAWSSRCQSVLASLESEIQKVRSDAARRTKREALAERQIKAVTDTDKSTGSGTAGAAPGSRSNNQRMKREQADDYDEDDDAMDVDAGSLAGPGKKKSGGGFLQKLGRGSR
jgi:COP9 signalosome complex subunit 7